MMLQEIHKIFQENAELFTVAGFLAGTLIGNHFSVERDRRIEFNKIVSPIYFKMKSQIEARLHYAEDFDIDVIEHYMPWYQKLCFRNCAERYKKSKNCVSTYIPGGEVLIDEIKKTEMLKCASDVLHYLKPR
jgi:hypothetical protein